jgi:hypothetical protein
MERLSASGEIKMSFVETFAGVFTAQLLIYFSQFIIEKYVKHRVEKRHDQIKEIFKIFEKKPEEKNDIR